MTVTSCCEHGSILIWIFHHSNNHAIIYCCGDCSGSVPICLGQCLTSIPEPYFSNI